MPLQAIGFKKYKSSFLARLTEGEVFQFLYFQKSGFGGNSFTVQAVIRPLFCPNFQDQLSLNPGNRLGVMASNGKNDKWWDYSTESAGEKSFKEVFSLVNKFAVPFFEKTKTSEEIAKAHKRNILGFSKFGKQIHWGSPGWADFNIAHIFLKSGDLEKSSFHFSKSENYFKDDENVFCREISQKSSHLKSVIVSGQANIDQYLRRTITESRENLNLNDW